jgi:hypothetical protein
VDEPPAIEIVGVDRGPDGIDRILGDQSSQARIGFPHRVGAELTIRQASPMSDPVQASSIRSVDVPSIVFLDFAPFEILFEKGDCAIHPEPAAEDVVDVSLRDKG